MIDVDADVFEAATHEHATASLRYAEGCIVTYDYEGLERWVQEIVIHNAPIYQTLIPIFPFAGEGLEASGPVGGVGQVEMAIEVAAAVEKDLESLESCARCHVRLVECMDFLHVLGGDAETAIGAY